MTGYRKVADAVHEGATYLAFMEQIVVKSKKIKKYFAGWKNVRNFALSKNGKVAPCLPVQVALFQIATYVDQLSVSGQNT